MTNPILPTQESAPPAPQEEAASTPSEPLSPDAPLPLLPEGTPTTPPDTVGEADAWTAPVFLGLEWNAPAIIAAGALVISILAYRASRKSLKISEAQEKRNAPKINPKVKKARAWESATESGTIWVGALLSIEHPSDRDGSISDAKLVLTYDTPADMEQGLKVPHRPSSKGEHSKCLQIPLRLFANDTQEGWLTFPIPKEWYRGKRFNMHIEIHDPREFVATKELGPLMEVDSDPTQAE